MTPGLSEEFCIMQDHTFSKLPNHLVKHHTTHKIGCQPGDCIYGHFNLPLGCVWVCMAWHAHVITPQGGSYIGESKHADEIEVLVLHDMSARSVLFNDTWSQQGCSVSCLTILFSSCKSPDQTPAHKVSCQPSDCIWSL